MGGALRREGSLPHLPISSPDPAPPHWLQPSRLCLETTGPLPSTNDAWRIHLFVKPGSCLLRRTVPTKASLWWPPGVAVPGVWSLGQPSCLWMETVN